MTRIDIHEGDLNEGRRWQRVKRDQTTVVYVTCPDCGARGTLCEHSIRSDGVVDPSLACPHAGCNFHEHVKLVGWTP